MRAHRCCLPIGGGGGGGGGGRVEGGLAPGASLYLNKQAKH